MKTTATFAILTAATFLAPFLSTHADLAMAAKFGTCHSGTDHFPRAFQRDVATRAVLRIVDRTDGTTGSGCLIARTAPSEYLVLTAAHVLRPGHRAEVFFYPFGPADSTTEVLEVLARDERRDFLLLRVRGIPHRPTIDICPRPQIPTGPFPVLVCGFPNGTFTMAASTATAQHFEDHKYNVKGTFLVLQQGFDGGISGAPVIARIAPDRFAVVAVVWGSQRSQESANGLASAEVADFVGHTRYARLLEQPRKPLLVARTPPGRTRPRPTDPLPPAGAAAFQHESVERGLHAVVELGGVLSVDIRRLLRDLPASDNRWLEIRSSASDGHGSHKCKRITISGGGHSIQIIQLKGGSVVRKLHIAN